MHIALLLYLCNCIWAAPRIEKLPCNSCTPMSRNPKAATLNPKPYTPKPLNPKPYTLNPQLRDGLHAEDVAFPSEGQESVELPAGEGLIVIKLNVGGCQNYGPFLGTLSIRCRTTIGTQKGTTIFTTTHVREP